jgi:hypothetical protein
MFSVATVLSYLAYTGQGMAVGALIGLSGREQDIVIAQHRGMCWLVASLVCQMGSAITAAVTLPFDFGESPWLRFPVRFALAAVLSVLLTLIIGTAALLVAAALRHSLVR